MRIILTILFLWAYAANATNYYVSNSGSDGNDGLTAGTAWQTIAKVNGSSFNAGDSILFKRGDSWNESFRLANSGSVGSPIVVGAYGTGNKPIITGFQTVNLTDHVGNIWSGIMTDSLSNNTVLVNGKIQAKGRYPNATDINGGYFTLTGSTTSYLVTSSGTDYTDKEIVVRASAWNMTVDTVSSQSGDTLWLKSNLPYSPSSWGVNGYFFQNDSTFLDVRGEWSYNASSRRLSVYYDSTSCPLVKKSVIDTLVLVKRDYITFDNISFEGANKVGIELDTSRHVTVQNCTINNSGAIGILGKKSAYASVLNDTIQNTLSNAIHLWAIPSSALVDTCNYATITGNYVKNSGIYPGMGLNQNEKYMGIYVVGHSARIENNQVDSSGYIGICFFSDSASVKNNYVTNFCFVNDDGGGIYTYAITTGYSNGALIKNNIVRGGIGAQNGKGWPAEAVGIYLDGVTKNVTVDSNSVSNCAYGGIYLHQSDSNVVRANNIFNGVGQGLLYSGTDGYFSAGGNQTKRNAIYSSSSLWYAMYRESGNNVGTIDSNYYSCPTNESGLLRLNSTQYGLAGWQTATSKDTFSKATPIGILGNAPVFYYNPTLSDSTITFSGQKVSLRGDYYNGSITLHPFTSAILYDAVTIIHYPYKSYR